MPDIEFLHDHIILDACCIITLFASLVIEPVLSAISISIAVSKYVAEKEALYCYSNPANGATPKKTEINLQPLIHHDLIEIVSLDINKEADTMVQFASELNDGEAATGAIAVNRNWAVGTDDKKATRIIREQSPKIQILSTPELMKNWAVSQNPSQRDVAVALRNIRLRGKYTPDPEHDFYNWWIKYENRI